MSPHPVQLHVDKLSHMPRIQIAIRLVIVVAIGLIGWSSIYWLLYLQIPAVVALVVLHKGTAHYVERTVPGLVRALRWLAVAYAYLCFLTDVLPTTEGSPVDLRIEATARPTPRSALMRILTSLPAMVLVALLAAAGSLVWVVVAVYALVTERIPGPLADFLVLVLRVKFRLAAYHLSLVDRYPSLAAEQLAPAPAV
jgi:hypothetical protein